MSAFQDSLKATGKLNVKHLAEDGSLINEYNFENLVVTTGLTYPLATSVFNDQSPQGNNWTPNNISGNIGATLDYMTDVPTLTSTTAANYSVLNPLPRPTNTLVFSNGNLNLTVGTPPSSTNNGAASGTIAVSSGKWYWEITAGDNFSGGANFTSVGIGNLSTINSTGDPSVAGAYMYYANGNNANGTFRDGTGSVSYGAAYKQGNIIGFAFDLDTNEFVIDFDTKYTKISADEQGNYFNIYMSGLEPERYFKILIKTNK
jgi:hypothetical protein